MKRRTVPITIVLSGVAILLGTIGCGGDSSSPMDPDENPAENVAPSIAPIEDQTVVRNTLEPRSLELQLDIDDPDDDSFQVEVTPDDEAVIAARTLECGSEPCALTLTPSPERTAVVNVQLTVTDGSGGEAQAGFDVNVVPLRVTDTGDDGAGSLRQTVLSAEAGDVIGFETGGTFESPQTILLTGQIVIEKALTIEGPGVDRVTVSGSDIARVFKVTGGATVVIQGLTIADGRAPLEEFVINDVVEPIAVGGGIFVEAGSKLTLGACDVTGSVAAAQDEQAFGGGIANFEATLIIQEESNIRDNRARNGGGIASFTFDGNETVTTIHNSTVSGNTATSSRGGGIYNLSGSVVVDASAITGNEASSGSGGGIANIGTLAIRSGSTVSENTALGAEPAQGGGGIDNLTNSSLTITESTVEANTARMGGGILNRGTLTLERSRVAANDANGEEVAFQEGGGGLLIDPQGTATIIGGRIEGNGSIRGGGGIMNMGELEISSDAVITGNDSPHFGGGIHNSDTAERLTIRGSTLEDNTAVRGAAVYAASGYRLENSSIVGNTATSAGGGIYSLAGDGALVNASVIEGNAAESGAGLYIRGDLTVRATEIRANAAAEDGGGVYYQGSGFSGSPAQTALENTLVQNNTARRGGGVFVTFASGESSGIATLFVQSDTRITGNTATEGGGFFQTQTFGSGSNARIVIDDSTVRGNTGTESGGGLLNEGGVLTIRSGSMIAENTAELVGGGIYNRPNVESFRETITTIANSTITGNTAASGAGIYNEDAELSLESGTVMTANAAGSDGGALNNDAAGKTVTIDDAQIGGAAEEGNTARLGGGIYNFNGQVELTNGTVISGNLAVLVGGGAYNDGTLILQSGTHINANTAEEPSPSGGGVYNVGTLDNNGDISGNTPDDIAP